MLKRKQTAFITALFVAIAVLLGAFQNCGKRFEVLPVPPSENHEIASLGSIEISFPIGSDLFNSSNNSLSFNILASGAETVTEVFCQLSGFDIVRDPEDCSLKSYSIKGLADGLYGLRVSVRTKSGDHFEAVKVFRIDSTPPTITNVVSPAVTTNQTSFEIMFLAADNLSGIKIVECSYNDEPFSPCQSPASISDMSSGPHSFKIKATDLAGNTSVLAQATWTVDLSIPTVNMIEKPGSVTRENQAQFVFNGSGIKNFKCRLDLESEYSDCTSPKTYRDLGEGSHTIKIIGQNQAGSLSYPSQYSWEVDFTSPNPPTTLTVNDSTATWSMAKDAITSIANYEIAVGSTVGSDDFVPWTNVGLNLTTNFNRPNDRSFYFSIRANDLAGNVSPLKTIFIEKLFLKCTLPFGSWRRHGETIMMFESTWGTTERPCSAQQVNWSCDDGTVKDSSGSPVTAEILERYKHSSCVQRPPGNCVLPNGLVLMGGTIIRMYERPDGAEEFPCQTNSIILMCQDGAVKDYSTGSSVAPDILVKYKYNNCQPKK